MRQRGASSCSAEDARACGFLVTQYGFGDPVRFGRNQLLETLMKKGRKLVVCLNGPRAETEPRVNVRVIRALDSRSS